MIRHLFLAMISSILLSAVSSAQMMHKHHQAAVVQRAIAVLDPTKGSSVHGVVTFETVEKGVHVVANVSGLKPGKHGFHVHEFGDCSSDSSLAAGGHFNPGGMRHGAPDSEMRHAGDMGNLTADDSGNAHLDYIDPMISLQGDHSIVGHGVIVHEKEDDLATQPTGNSGARIGCGVIAMAVATEPVGASGSSGAP